MTKGRRDDERDKIGGGRRWLRPPISLHDVFITVPLIRNGKRCIPVSMHDVFQNRIDGDEKESSLETERATLDDDRKRGEDVVDCGDDKGKTDEESSLMTEKASVLDQDNTHVKSRPKKMKKASVRDQDETPVRPKKMKKASVRDQDKTPVRPKEMKRTMRRRGTGFEAAPNGY